MRSLYKGGEAAFRVANDVISPASAIPPLYVINPWCLITLTSAVSFTGKYFGNIGEMLDAIQCVFCSSKES